MTKIEHLRNKIIEKVRHIEDAAYLNALHEIVNNVSEKNADIIISNEQEQMLRLSELDIAHNRVINHSDLMKKTMEWLGTK